MPALLGNISTRGFVGTGNNVMIGGFIINGSTSKKVMLRALGPTLGQSPFNISGALPDPVLELHAANGTLITSNNNWMSAANASAVSASGNHPRMRRSRPSLPHWFRAATPLLCAAQETLLGWLW